MRLRRIPTLALLAALSCFTLRLKPRKTGKIALRTQSEYPYRAQAKLTRRLNSFDWIFEQ
jgi:hypothetical protein